MKKDRITTILVGIANTFFLICIVFLFITTLFSTVYMTTDTKIYFVRDSIVRNVIYIFFCAAFFVAAEFLSFKGKIEVIRKKAAKVKWIIVILICFISFLWIIGNQVIPAADQYELQKAAAEMFEGDYSTFQPGGYLDRYHFQCGYVLVIMALTPLIGTYNYMFWMVINAIALIPVLIGVIYLCDMFGIDNTNQEIILTVLGLGSPLIMYTTFPYGNILGLAFSVWMVYFALKYIDKPKTSYCIFVFLLFVFSLIFKSTFKIWGVAVVIYSLYCMIKQKNIKLIGLPLAIVSAYFISSLGPLEICKLISGNELDQGVGNWALLAMGLQEGGSAPGWWNGYNWYTYDGNGFNKDATDYVAKIVFRKRCAEFYHNIPYAFSFFYRKIVSEWNNPTFQGFYYNSIRDISNQRCGLVEWMLSDRGVYVETIGLKFFHTNVLFGSLLYGLRRKTNEKTIRAMLFPVIFVGAFMFFTLWEAQSQNTWVFYMLLIPYSIVGYRSFARKIKEKKIVVFFKQNYVKCLAVGALTMLFVVIYWFMCPGCLSENTTEYLELLK